MKKLAIIAAVVFTTLSLQSCRQAEDVMSPEEAATLQRVQDSSKNLQERNNVNHLNDQDNSSTQSLVDGEILPPPRK